MKVWKMGTSVILWLLGDGSSIDFDSGGVYHYHSVKVQVCVRGEGNPFPSGSGHTSWLTWPSAQVRITPPAGSLGLVHFPTKAYVTAFTWSQPHAGNFIS